ncbi:MAG: two-component regulator propeller domain-containing protein, partial [Ignavibacteria bacterium]
MLRVLFYRIIITLILVVPNIPAQANIRFNHLTVENGLSQSAVTCILQDNKGFMWFGTQDGLNRYDGYNFKVFKNNPEDSATLSDNFIFSIYEDRSGILYVETQSSEFHKYNPAAESFSVVIKDSIDLSGASFNTVGAIFEELSGVIWTGGLSRSIGLTKEDKKTGRITHFKHNPSDPSSLSDDKVYSILRDRNGNLWIGTFNGLDRLDEKTGKFYHYRNDPSNPNSIADNWIWPLYEDTKGNLWIGTVRGGLSKFDPATKSFYNYKNNPSEPASINDNFIFSIYQDRSGVIWIGTNTGGINYFHPSSQVFEHYQSETGAKNSLADNDILSLFADNAGNYWIGTRNGGLSKFNYSAKRFTNYFTNS